MKKKVFLIIIILLIFFLGINGYAEQVVVNTNGGEQSCVGLFGPLLNELKDILDTIHLLVPVILLLLTSFDFAKVVFADNKDGLNKAKNNFLKRCVAALIVFFAPDLLIMILTLVNEGDISSCIEEMQNNNRYQFVEQNNKQPQNPVITTENQHTSNDNIFGNDVTEIRIYTKEINLIVGENYKIEWDVFPVNASNSSVAFSSNNLGVAEVNQNGYVIARSAGVAGIKLTASNGVSSECTVRVTNDANKLNIKQVTYGSGSFPGVGNYLIIEIESSSKYDRIYFCTGNCVIDNNTINTAQELGTFGLGTGYIEPKEDNKLYYYKFNSVLRRTFNFEFAIGKTFNYAIGTSDGNSINISDVQSHTYDDNENFN